MMLLPNRLLSQFVKVPLAVVRAYFAVFKIFQGMIDGCLVSWRVGSLSGVICA